MRLIVREILDYPRSATAHYASSWRMFVTDPIDTTMLGPIRIIFGTLCL